MPVQATLGDMVVRDATLDPKSVERGLAALMPAIAACAKTETWSTYSAQLRIVDGKLDRLSSSTNPIMTRDPKSGTWGTSAPPGLADCVAHALHTIQLDPKTGSGRASIDISVHPVLAHPPVLEITSELATSHRAELEACFIPRWYLSPVMHGTVTVTATVDAHGAVTKATSDGTWKSLGACFASEIQKITFPTKSTTAQIVLELKPGS